MHSALPPVETARGHAFPAAAKRLFGNVTLAFPNGLEDLSRLRSATLGKCRLSRLEAETHTVFGDHVVTGSDDPDSIKLIVQTAGRSELSQCGRNLEVGGQHIVLYDPTRPYILTNQTAVRLLLLQLPRTAFGSSFLRRLREPFPIPAQAAGLNRVLASMMASTLSEIDTLDETMRSTVGETMTGLVRNLVADTNPTRTSMTPPLEMLMHRIERYVADNLANTSLDVRNIARKMGCSERYVYRAFETRETTPADYIWSQRLDQAASQLRHSPHQPGTISRIAFDLGFTSSAHFARAFRNRYRMTPSQWQRLESNQVFSPGI